MDFSARAVYSFRLPLGLFFFLFSFWCLFVKKMFICQLGLGVCLEAQQEFICGWISMRDYSFFVGGF